MPSWSATGWLYWSHSPIMGETKFFNLKQLIAFRADLKPRPTVNAVLLGLYLMPPMRLQLNHNPATIK